ncbi:MAG: 4-hydroxy-tetrahydrodipicolinate reductase, partial [Muribaculaceae bacterium]|nr:4-hydroxy-tetrahydrodipicolinate reductase [Muribaculaceae bacterium]
MKIALIGYGKMGRAIERFALERGHRIIARIDSHNPEEWDADTLRHADVAIEFTTPSAAVDNYFKAFERHIPLVSGTTAWTDRIDEVRGVCEAHGASFLWSSNFSIGVNVFMALNRYLAAIMAGLPQYHPAMNEIHHIHKLDHPSGTAITLAEQIIAANPSIQSWTEDPDTSEGSIVISHERLGEVPGTHIISWDSTVDTITIEHRAKSRDGFALGAVMAAEWLADHPGYHTIDEMMADMLHIK